MVCRAFAISETCYRYQAKLSGENALVADWLLRLTDGTIVIMTMTPAATAAITRRPVTITFSKTDRSTVLIPPGPGTTLGNLYGHSRWRLLRIGFYNA